MGVGHLESRERGSEEAVTDCDLVLLILLTLVLPGWILSTLLILDMVKKHDKR